MRILYVVRYPPYVPSPGGITRTYHLVYAATEVADVTLVWPSEDVGGPYPDEIAARCDKVCMIPPPSSPPGRPNTVQPARSRLVTAISHVVRALSGADALTEAAIDRDALRATVRELLQCGGYDLVVAEYTGIAMLLRDVVRQWGGPSVVNLYDVVHVLQQRTQAMQLKERGRRRPSISGWQRVRRLRSIERDIVQSYARVTAVSAVDAGYLQQLCPGKAIDVLPNGVDITYFEATDAAIPVDRGAADNVDTLIFTGSLGHYPNRDALSYFLADIWPLIRRRRPQTRFWIVGSGPVPRMLERDALPDGIEVFISVPDIRPYLVASTAAVVPLRLGTGTRLKILEALAARVPVVSTSLGAEGLDLTAGRDLLIGDTPASFAEAVIALLERRAYAQTLATHGQETVRRLYNWTAIRQEYQELLQRVVAVSV